MATIRKLRGRWQAMVRRKGIKPRCKSFDAKSDAERWARAIEAEVDQGTFVDRAIADKTTLGDILTRYSAEISVNKRGAKQEQQRIGVLLRHEMAHRYIAALTPAHVASFRDERLRTVAPSTAVRELAILSHAVDVSMREWGIHLARNPVKHIRRPAVSDSRSRRLLPGEEDRLLAACASGRTAGLDHLITVAIETGMRRSELLSLRWADIDFDRRTAALFLTKNGDAREVPLSSRALAALRRMEAEQAAGPSGPFMLTAGALEQAWRRLLRRSGILGLRFHDLRHEAVSRLFERGLGIMEVASISGHREIKMLSRYTHLKAADLAGRLG
ncbi:MAG: site-specific integrase [Phreatobacter sp.]|uniref:site-specific integrase n=1 Tax=Phreatobacter sp. TaxID=1966341 RepID=UPI00403533BE